MASRYNWKRIAILADDSDWGVEASAAFVRDSHPDLRLRTLSNVVGLIQ